MFRNETAVAGPVFRDFPRSSEIGAGCRRQDEIARPDGLKELQQLARCVRQVGLAGAGEQVSVVELQIPAEPQRIATLKIYDKKSDPGTCRGRQFFTRASPTQP